MTGLHTRTCTHTHARIQGAGQCAHTFHSYDHDSCPVCRCQNGSLRSAWAKTAMMPRSVRRVSISFAVACTTSAAGGARLSSAACVSASCVRCVCVCIRACMSVCARMYACTHVRACKSYVYVRTRRHAQAHARNNLSFSRSLILCLRVCMMQAALHHYSTTLKNFFRGWGGGRAVAGSTIGISYVVRAHLYITYSIENIFYSERIYTARACAHAQRNKTLMFLCMCAYVCICMRACIYVYAYVLVVYVYVCICIRVCIFTCITCITCT